MINSPGYVFMVLVSIFISKTMERNAHCKRYVAHTYGQTYASSTVSRQFGAEAKTKADNTSYVLLLTITHYSGYDISHIEK